MFQPFRKANNSRIIAEEYEFGSLFEDYFLNGKLYTPPVAQFISDRAAIKSVGSVRYWTYRIVFQLFQKAKNSRRIAQEYEFGSLLYDLFWHIAHPTSRRVYLGLSSELDHWLYPVFNLSAGVSTIP